MSETNHTRADRPLKRGKVSRQRILSLLICLYIGAVCASACDYTSEPVVIGEYKAPTATLENR